MDSRRKKNWYSRMLRTLGPMFSVALHVLIVVVLIHTVGFAHRDKDMEIKVKIVEQVDIDLDDLLEIEEPAPVEEVASPDPLNAEQLMELTEELNVDVESPDIDDVAMLDNLSPLVLKGIGADRESLGQLTSLYGDRAERNGLLGTYFNRVDFAGGSHSRIDPTLNYYWELESPWPQVINDDLFSVIWTGRIVPPRSGVYTFYLESDDGARLWIEDELVLDQFVERQRATDTIQMWLQIGKSYDIKYAFCEVFQHAVSKLEWSCEEAGIPRQLIPSKHMWADGKYSSQLIAWSESRGRGHSAVYANRSQMRNPAMIEGKPFSHIVGYESLDIPALTRLELEDLKPDFNAYQQKGIPPTSAALPALPPGMERVRDEPKYDDIKIEIF